MCTPSPPSIPPTTIAISAGPTVAGRATRRRGKAIDGGPFAPRHGLRLAAIGAIGAVGAVGAVGAIGAIVAAPVGAVAARRRLAGAAVRAPALAPPRAGQPRRPALPPAAARLLPQPGRRRRHAALEPLAERRPTDPLQPQLRGVLSADLARPAAATGVRAERAGDAPRGHRFRRRVAPRPPAPGPARRRGAGGCRLHRRRRAAVDARGLYPVLQHGLAPLGAGAGRRRAAPSGGRHLAPAGSARRPGARHAAAHRALDRGD